VQIENSDVVSFHDYSWPEEFKRRAQEVRSFGRPVICTEYMARSAGSTFDGSLPIGKSLNIGMLNWGFVDGKTQTKFPGDSVLFPYVGARQPTIWFHDVLGRDGTPYRRAEIELIRAMANSPKGVVPDLPWTIAER
jgi:hypothetical protein